MGMLSKRLSKLLLDTLCDKFKNDGVLFLDCYNDVAYNNIAPTITTRINSSNHYYLMFIYAANSNTADGGCYIIHHPRSTGGGISIANIKNPGHFTKVCAIEIYETVD